MLEQIGVRFQVRSFPVDESPVPGETAEALALRVAGAKAQAAWRNLHGDGLPVLSADTVVTQDDRLMGKPGDRREALAMLRRLSAQEHRVYTAVALMDGQLRTGVSCTRVRFRAIDDREAEAYWRSGEPRDKAGGYAIQGLGAVFVEAISGSYSGVMGLPLFETAQLLQQAGIRLLSVDKESP